MTTGAEHDGIVPPGRASVVGLEPEYGTVTMDLFGAYGNSDRHRRNERVLLP